MLSPDPKTKSFVNRELLFKLLIPVFVVVVLLSVAEFVTHKLRPDLGWRLLADTYLGWISEEYLSFDPMSRPDSDTLQLLFLGDSFLAGAGISDLDQRFPLQAGAQLPRVRVQILATGGWGTDQQMLAYLAKGADWLPDFVFLCFCCNNDLSNNLSNSHGTSNMMKPYFALTAEGTLELYDPTGQPLDLHRHVPDTATRHFHSYLLDYVRFRLSRMKEQPPPVYPEVDPRYQLFLRERERSEELYRLQDLLTWSPQDGVNHVSAYIHEPFPINTYQWDLFAALLKQLHNETEKQGAQLVVVLIPVTYNPRNPLFIVGSSLEHEFQTPTGSFTFRAAEPRERLQEICQRQGIPLFDPSFDFRKIVEEDQLARQCWPDLEDRHFSEVGHRVVADLFAAYLRNNFSKFSEQFTEPDTEQLSGQVSDKDTDLVSSPAARSH